MEVGDIVLLVEKNIARGQWNTGSVMKTYPGLDKLVRVVDVKTSDGIYKRAIHTLCPSDRRRNWIIPRSGKPSFRGYMNRREFLLFLIFFCFFF